MSGFGEEMICKGVEEDGQLEVEEEEVVLPGFRFHPTDEELVDFYLRRKVERRTISKEIIKEIDIYKYDPWELPRACILGEKESYFFCLRGRKYRNSIRPNRVTAGSGFWKATGIDRPIYSYNNSHNLIGLKKSLVYYQGTAGKGNKTNWMMHEYRLPSKPNCIQDAEVWTLCRIINKNQSFKKFKEQLSWKEVNKSSNFSSKISGSFDSDSGEEKDLGGCYLQRDNSCAGNRMEETHVNETLREGNWGEIGRMVDYMVEAATGYDFAYY